MRLWSTVKGHVGLTMAPLPPDPGPFEEQFPVGLGIRSIRGLFSGNEPISIKLLVPGLADGSYRENNCRYDSRPKTSPPERPDLQEPRHRRGGLCPNGANHGEEVTTHRPFRWKT